MRIFNRKQHWLPRGRHGERRPTTSDGSLGDSMDFDLRRPRPAGIWIGAPIAGTLGWIAWESAERGGSVVVWLVIAGAVLVGGLAVEYRSHVRWQQTMGEIERARLDLPFLRTELADRMARGEGIVQSLRERGYRQFDVRRWIERQLRTPPKPEP